MLRAVVLLPLAGFQTRLLKRLEPVTDFRLSHSEMHLASTVHEKRMVDGVLRPMPDSVNLKFTAFGVEHQYDVRLARALRVVLRAFSTSARCSQLDLMTDLYPVDSYTTLASAAGETRVPNRLTSYNRYIEGGFITATFFEDGTFQVRSLLVLCRCL